MSSGTTIGPIPHGPLAAGGAGADSAAKAPGWTLPNSIEDVQGRFLANLFSIELAILVFTQKIALPLSSAGGRSQIAFALVLHYAVLGILAWKGMLRIAPWRLLLFCLFAGTSLVFHARAENTEYSFTSILLVILIVAFYVFVVPIKRQYYLIIVKNFVILACIAGVLTWLDWVTQLSGLGKTNLDNFIPDLFRYREYNYWNKMWGGPLHIKPNGTFFLEMSHLSQFIATGFIFEILFFRRLPVMIFLGLSTVGAFGGTGLTVLACSLPFLLHRLPLSTLLAGLVALPLLLGTAYQLGYVDAALSRSQEFDKNKSSANQRFVRPFEETVKAFTGPMDELIMGHGAGTMSKTKLVKLNTTIEEGVTWAPYSKVINEYGIVAFFFWFTLIFISMFRPGIPLAASVALFVQYHLLNGSLAVPLHTVYAFLLVTCYIFTDDETTPAAAMPEPEGRPLGSLSTH